MNTGSSMRGVYEPKEMKVSGRRRILNPCEGPLNNLPYIRSSISGLVYLLPERALQDGLPVQPEQSAANKLPGALLVEPSWDSQMFPPQDTPR